MLVKQALRHAVRSMQLQVSPHELHGAAHLQWMKLQIQQGADLASRWQDTGESAGQPYAWIEFSPSVLPLDGQTLLTPTGFAADTLVPRLNGQSRGSKLCMLEITGRHQRPKKRRRGADRNLVFAGQPDAEIQALWELDRMSKYRHLVMDTPLPHHRVWEQRTAVTAATGATPLPPAGECSLAVSQRSPSDTGRHNPEIPPGSTLRIQGSPGPQPLLTSQTMGQSLQLDLLECLRNDTRVLECQEMVLKQMSAGKEATLARGTTAMPSPPPTANSMSLQTEGNEEQLLEHKLARHHEPLQVVPLKEGCPGQRAVGVALGSHEIAYAGSVESLMQNLEEGATYQAPTPFVAQAGALVATNRGSIILPTPELRKQERCLRAGMADIRSRLPHQSTTATMFYAWVLYAVDKVAARSQHLSRLTALRIGFRSWQQGQHTRQTPPKSTLAKAVFALPTQQNDLRQTLWLSPKKKVRWLRLARRLNNPWLYRLIMYGADVYGWAKNPTLPPIQPPEAWPTGPLDEVKLCFAEDTMEELVQMGAAEWLDDPLTEAEWNRLKYDKKALLAHMKQIEFSDPTRTRWRLFQAAHAIPKKEDCPLLRVFRVILDYSGLFGNDIPSWVRATYSHKGLRDILRIIRPGCFLAGIDLRKWFHQFPVSERTVQAQYMWLRGRRLRLTRLAMGLQISPLISQNVINVIMAEVRLRHPTAALSALIDDVYLSDSSWWEALLASKALIDVCNYYGVLISTSKSHPIPHHLFKVLRSIVNTFTMQIYTSAATQKSIRDQASKLLYQLQHKKPFGPRQLASLLGVIQSTADSAMLQVMSTTGLRDLQTRCLRLAHQNWDRLFTADKTEEFPAIHDLTRCLQIACWNGRPLLSLVPDQVIASDGSPTAAGAVLLTGGEGAAGTNPEVSLVSKIGLRLLFSRWESANLSQNAREITSAALAIVTFVKAKKWTYQVIALITDSMTCRRYLQKGGGTFNLAMMARRLHDWLWHTTRCRLLVLWSHGKQLYLADSWSRPHGDQTIWAMSPDAVRLLQNHHRTTFTLDAQASNASRICQKFIGDHPSPAIGDDQVGTNMLSPGLHMDSLLQQSVWIMPQRRHLGKILVRLQQAQAPEVYLAVMNPTTNLPELSEILRFLVRPPSVTGSYDGLFCPLWSPEHARLVHRAGILVVFPLSFVLQNEKDSEEMHYFVSTQRSIENCVKLTTVPGMPFDVSRRRVQVIDYLRRAIRSRRSSTGPSSEH